MCRHRHRPGQARLPLSDGARAAGHPWPPCHPAHGAPQPAHGSGSPPATPPTHGSTQPLPAVLLPSRSSFASFVKPSLPAKLPQGPPQPCGGYVMPATRRLIQSVPPAAPAGASDSAAAAAASCLAARLGRLGASRARKSSKGSRKPAAARKCGPTLPPGRVRGRRDHPLRQALVGDSRACTDCGIVNSVNRRSKNVTRPVLRVLPQSAPSDRLSSRPHGPRQTLLGEVGTHPGLPGDINDVRIANLIY